MQYAPRLAIKLISCNLHSGAMGPRRPKPWRAVSAAIRRASSRASNLAAENAGRGTNFVPASYFQLSDGPKSRSSFSRVSRRDFQYRTNNSGPAARKSCSTARRQNGLRLLNQACPSGGKRGKIESSKIGLGVSVVFLTAAPGSVGCNSSSNALMRSSSNVTPL